MAAVLLPAQLLTRAARAVKVAEVGAGGAFETALALKRAAPGAVFVVTDVDPRVLAAPPPLVAMVHDAAQDDPAALEGADLVYSVRPPEELQLPIARLARRLGADLALRPLKDEWADVGAAFPVSVVWPHGWRFFPHPSRTRCEG